MRHLIESYNSRIETVKEILSNFRSNGSFFDNAKEVRLKTKQSEYRTFAAELEVARKQNKEAILDLLLKFAPDADAQEVQKYISDNF